MATADIPTLNPSERLVWDALGRQLPVGAEMIPNLRLAGNEQDHEIDILVLLPDAGVVVLEVKGGAVSADEQGRWWQSSGNTKHQIDPVNQAMRAKHMARRYAENDPRWSASSRTRTRWAHVVVVPYTSVPDDFSHPDCPRSMLIGATDLPRIGELVHQASERQETGQRRPTADDVETLVEIFTRMRPMAADVTAESDERSDVASRLTREQATLLDVTRLLNRVEIRGGAGSGKTMLALTQATRLTRGGQGVSGQRVALLCYSYGLASFFE